MTMEEAAIDSLTESHSALREAPFRERLEPLADQVGVPRRL